MNIVRNSIKFCAVLVVGASCYIAVETGYLPFWRNFAEVRNESVIDASFSETSYLNSNLALDSLLNSNSDRSLITLLIEKSQRRLTIYYQNQPIKSYPVVLGGNPVGNKLREGDGKTPEGLFGIRDLYPHPQWSKFIWIDYPTQESWENHINAKKQGAIPASATIGGEIGIHGVPKGRDYLVSKGQDWTLGCISLTNRDVDEIYPWLQIGTRVEIVP